MRTEELAATYADYATGPQKYFLNPPHSRNQRNSRLILQFSSKPGTSCSIRHRHQTCRIGVTVQEESEVGRHHFFPALKTLVDPSGRIGVELVIYRIVVSEFEVHSGALR